MKQNQWQTLNDQKIDKEIIMGPSLPLITRQADEMR